MRPPRRPRRAAVAALVVVLGAACAPGSVPSSIPGSPAGSPPRSTPGPTPEPTAGAVPEPSPDPASGTASQPEAGEGPSEGVQVATSVVATGLDVPWDVAFTPDGRTFVSERDSGRLLELDADGSAAEVQRLPVEPAGEGGLLGLAVSPAFEDDGVLYAYLTTAQDNRVVRFRPGEEPQPVLTGIPAGRVHNGGRIAFGPDGLLYVGTGDAGRSSLAADPGSLAGKVLRVTPDGAPAEGNPTAGSAVYASGLRNVQGLAFTADGDLYATEFGPDADDEVNLIRAGASYGWPDVTGAAGQPGSRDPVLVRQPPDASWSGAVVLRDGAVPQWEGSLFAAGLRGERLWRLALAPDGGVAEAEELLVGELGRLRHVAQAPDGSLWVLTSNRDGRGTPVPGDDRIVRLGPGG